MTMVESAEQALATGASEEGSLKEAAIGNLHILEKEAFAFFAVYARYEYAAKVCRFVHQESVGQHLVINPQLVADKIRQQFAIQVENTPLLREAVEYYDEYPPQKQVWDGNNAAWSTQEHQGNDDVKRLLLQLAQARNNLFHGGKGWKSDVADIERDNALIRHGLKILEAIIRSDDVLVHEFSSFE